MSRTHNSMQALTCAPHAYTHRIKAETCQIMRQNMDIKKFTAPLDLYFENLEEPVKLCLEGLSSLFRFAPRVSEILQLLGVRKLPSNTKLTASITTYRQKKKRTKSNV